MRCGGVDVEVPAEAAGQIEDVDLVEVDAVAREDDVQAGDVGALGLRQLVDVALQEVDAVSRSSSVMRLDVVFEAAHLVHPAGAQQFAQQVDQAGAADALGRAVADDAEVECAVVADRDVFDGAVERGHAAGDGAAFERRAGGAGGRENAMLVAEDQLGVGADVHDRDEAVFVREVDGQHAGGGVGADVAADDRERRRRGPWDGSAAGSGGRSA